MTSPVRTVVVIGGGIAGLAAAHRLGELDPKVRITVLEAAPRAGGILHTVAQDGWLIERGADSFLVDEPWAVDLCQRVGLEGELIAPSEHFRGAYVVHRGGLVKVPAGFMLMAPTRLRPLLSSPLLSLRGKVRVLAEYFVRPRPDMADESLASFVRRRLGREAYERLVQPLAAGIYSGDGERLSMAAAMPRFLALERQFGSLIRGGRMQGGRSEATASAARYGLMASLRRGVGHLADALAATLGERLRLRAPVERLYRLPEGGWRAELRSTSAEPRSIDADAVILATSAREAARLLAEADPELARELGSIGHAGMAVVSTGYREDQIGRPLEAFGLVAPQVERRPIVAASFASIKFAGRAPDGHLLVRTFLGGESAPELVDAPEEELKGIVRRELGALIEARGEPVVWDIARWRQAMPQYHVGHLDLVARIERRLSQLAGLQLAGNAYRGVGIPQCIRSGQEAAESTVQSLAMSAARHL